MQIGTVEGNVLDLGWEFYPVQALGRLSPEGFIVLDGLAVFTLIGVFVEVCSAFKRFRYGI
jgi:hypothetical protein